MSFYQASAGARFLIRRSAGRGEPNPTLVELGVQCANGTCQVNPRSRPLPEGTFARRGMDGSLLVHGPDRFERYASVNDYFLAHPSVAARLPGLPADAEDRVTADGVPSLVGRFHEELASRTPVGLR